MPLPATARFLLAVKRNMRLRSGRARPLKRMVDVNELVGGEVGVEGEPGARRNLRPDARQRGQTPLPVTGLVSQIYTAGLREHGEKDISAVSEARRR